MIRDVANPRPHGRHRAAVRDQGFWRATRTPEHELAPAAPWGAVADGLRRPGTLLWIAAGVAAGWGLERLAGTGSFLWWGATALWFAAGLPLLMAALVGLASLAIVATLGPSAWLCGRLAGRPSGVRSLTSELGRLAGDIVPRYLRALRRVQKPRAWALALGAIAWWCVRAACSAA